MPSPATSSGCSALMLMFFLSGMTVPLKLAIIPLFIQLDTLRSHRQLCRPGAGLCRHGHSLGGLHHDRLPAHAAARAGRSPRASTAPASCASCCSIMLPLARPAHGDRGDPECRADLERLLLPAGPDHFGQSEDPAAGPDRLHGRVHHRLGRAVHRPDAGRAADHPALHRAVQAVHRRASPRAR